MDVFKGGNYMSLYIQSILFWGIDCMLVMYYLQDKIIANGWTNREKEMDAYMALVLFCLFMCIPIIRFIFFLVILYMGTHENHGQF